MPSLIVQLPDSYTSRSRISRNSRSRNDPDKPNTYLIFSVVTAIICCIPGMIVCGVIGCTAIGYSLLVIPTVTVEVASLQVLARDATG